MAETNTSGNAVIEVAQVEKSFGDLHVLKDFSLTLEKGENLVVMGRSGVGKSVLIKCVVGLLKPDSGTLRVLGADIPELDSKALNELRVKIGYLFQGSALYDSMTVEENLRFPLRTLKRQLSRKEMRTKVMEALEQVGLPEKAWVMPSELSGGMQKRIGLARALIRQPEIMLYDEPTAGLDPLTGKEISSLIVDVQKQFNASSIIITHDITCARIAADRIAVIEEGSVHAIGTYDELSRSEDPVISKFFE